MPDAATLTLIGLVVAVLVLILYLAAVYNGLIQVQNQFKNAFAQIDVQLKRRYDLIPNLVETVKGYMTHEKGTLEAVIQARNLAYNAGQKAAAKPGDPQAMNELSAAEGQLGGALGRLLAVSEAYPELKANTTMITLQEELTSTENKIGFARQAYNDAVTTYNNRLQMFPTNILGGIFGFAPAVLLQVIDSAAQREAPKVSFN
jgi:LemA protein